SYGPSPLTRDLGFLDQLGACPWEDAPAVALSAWTEVDARFGDRPHLRARLREGVFGRLLASHAPDALVEARPECLPMVAAPLDEARRRMKRLQPGLHALYMRRGRVILTASGV